METHDIRNKPARGWFYIDMEKALLGDGDREDAVIFVPGSKIRVDFRGQALLDLDAGARVRQPDVSVHRGVPLHCSG